MVVFHCFMLGRQRYPSGILWLQAIRKGHKFQISFTSSLNPQFIHGCKKKDWQTQGEQPLYFKVKSQKMTLQYIKKIQKNSQK